MAYVIGKPFMKMNEAVANDTRIVISTDYTEEEIQFSDYMMELWTNFAKYG